MGFQFKICLFLLFVFEFTFAVWVTLPDEKLPWLGIQLQQVHLLWGFALLKKAAFLHQFMTKCPATPLQKEHKYFKYTFHIFPTLS